MVSVLAFSSYDSRSSSQKNVVDKNKLKQKDARVGTFIKHKPSTRAPAPGFSFPGSEVETFNSGNVLGPKVVAPIQTHLCLNEPQS